MRLGKHRTGLYGPGSFGWFWATQLRRGATYAASASCLLFVVSILALRAASDTPISAGKRQLLPNGLVFAEFDDQSALLLAWPNAASAPFPERVVDLFQREEQVLCDIVEAVHNEVQVVILTRDGKSEERITKQLSAAHVPEDAVRFVHVPCHTSWIRDYGPIGVRAADGSFLLVDTDYIDSDDIVSLKPQNDRVPSQLGRLLNLQTVHAPIAIQQGNLLTDGRGLFVATKRLLSDNVARGYDVNDIRALLAHYLGATDLVLLDSLHGEQTGHVDMFATFVDPDTIVVGACSPETDPINAKILDANAAALASISGSRGRLKVIRIPMPPNPQKGPVTLWPTYTNVVFANKTLIVPMFPQLDPIGGQAAIDIYRRLLPGRRVVGIDATPLMQLCGGPHCATLNLPLLERPDR